MFTISTLQYFAVSDLQQKPLHIVLRYKACFHILLTNIFIKLVLLSLVVTICMKYYSVTQFVRDYNFLHFLQTVLPIFPEIRKPYHGTTSSISKFCTGCIREKGNCKILITSGIHDVLLHFNGNSQSFTFILFIFHS